MIDINELKRSEIDKNQELKSEILSFLLNSKIKLCWISNYKQIIYHYINNITEVPKCYCGEFNNFKSSVIGYRKTCSPNCSNKSFSKKSKTKKTKLEKYGDENYNNQNKVKFTKLEKYGDENYNNREKAFKTNEIKYGSYSAMKNEDVVNLGKLTKSQRYGDLNYNNIEKIKKFWSEVNKSYRDIITSKVKLSKLEKYGDENYNNTTQMVKTKLETYGYYYTNVESMINTAKDKFNKRIKHLNLKYIRHDDSSYFISCDDCDNNFTISKTMFHLRINNCEKICTLCNPRYQSKMQKDILNFIKENYKGEAISDDRKTLNGKEIDIYLPEIKLGIEFNGCYWHSIFEKDKSYHYNKKKIALKNKIDLIFIWEDEWLERTECIKDLIIKIINIKINNIRIDISDCPSDLYISNFGQIKEWLDPISTIRMGYETYDSGIILT